MYFTGGTPFSQINRANNSPVENGTDKPWREVAYNNRKMLVS